MPPTQPPCTVLVTGANGFIGSWVIRRLLVAGYIVHGVVRSELKGEHVLQCFKHEADKQRFRLVVVPDICGEGAFNEVLREVDAVVHTACPIAPSDEVDTLEAIMQPALVGTMNLLRSAHSSGTRVRRIVITGSAGAMLKPGANTAHEYNADDFNEEALQIVCEQGDGARFFEQYCAAKVLADRAVLDFVRDEKPSFDCTILLLPHVIGPEILPGKRSIADLNFSNQRFYHRFGHPAPPGKETSDALPWFDVKTGADAHVRALSSTTVSNRRVSLSGPGTALQDWYDAYHSIQPPLWLAIPKGMPGLGDSVRARLEHITNESSLFGLNLPTLAQTIGETLKYIAVAGLIEQPSGVPLRAKL